MLRRHEYQISLSDEERHMILDEIITENLATPDLLVRNLKLTYNVNKDPRLQDDIAYLEDHWKLV